MPKGDERPLPTKLRRKMLPFGLCLSALAALMLLENAMPAMGQELEPRSYSASPIDSNFAVGVLSNSTGTVPLDPSLPLSDVRPAINTVILSFTHTFRLGNRTANWAVSIPYLGGHVSALVTGQPKEFSRYEFADFRARFGVNLLGLALTPAEFARRKPSTTLGVSMTVIMPTGTYDRTQLINVGSNRWTHKPEIGFEQPLGVKRCGKCRSASSSFIWGISFVRTSGLPLMRTTIRGVRPASTVQRRSTHWPTLATG
jgi:hypothetical protein